MKYLSEEQEQKIIDNHSLIFSFMRKYRLQEQYYGACAEGLIDAVTTYKPNLSKFSTYAFTCMYNRFNQQYKAERTKKRFANEAPIPLDYEFDDSTKVIDSIPCKCRVEDNILAESTLNEILQCCDDDLDVKIIYLLATGYKQSDIMRKLSISRQVINNRKMKIQRRYESKVN